MGDAEVFDDVDLAFGGIFPHIEFEEFFEVGVFSDADLFESDVGADEVAEFIRGDFAEAFEPGDFRFGGESMDGVVAFLVAVAIAGFLFIAHPE